MKTLNLSENVILNRNLFSLGLLFDLDTRNKQEQHLHVTYLLTYLGLLR